MFGNTHGRRIRRFEKNGVFEGQKVIDECLTTTSFEDFLRVLTQHSIPTDFFVGDDLKGTTVAASFNDGCICELKKQYRGCPLWVPEKKIENDATIGHIYSGHYDHFLFGIKHDSTRFARAHFSVPLDETKFREGIFVNKKTL